MLQRDAFCGKHAARHKVENVILQKAITKEIAMQAWPGTHRDLEPPAQEVLYTPLMSCHVVQVMLSALTPGSRQHCQTLTMVTLGPR